MAQSSELILAESNLVKESVRKVAEVAKSLKETVTSYGFCRCLALGVTAGAISNHLYCKYGQAIADKVVDLFREVTRIGEKTTSSLSQK